MKYIFILLLFIYSQISFAQQNIENIIETATCKCIGLIDAFENNNKEKFYDCFVQAISKNAAVVEVEVKNYTEKLRLKPGKNLEWLSCKS